MRWRIGGGSPPPRRKGVKSRCERHYSTTDGRTIGKILRDKRIDDSCVVLYVNMGEYSRIMKIDRPCYIRSGIQFAAENTSEPLRGSSVWISVPLNSVSRVDTLLDTLLDAMLDAV